MDLRKLKTLIELVEGSGIAELEISEGEERVRITRTVAAASRYMRLPRNPPPHRPRRHPPLRQRNPPNPPHPKAMW